MTPEEAYRYTPAYITRDLGLLAGCYYNHVEEAFPDAYFMLNGKTSERVEIRVLRDFRFDFRRIWRLATVWFDGAPVMVIQNAGREGDDHCARFITDAAAFKALCAHLVAEFDQLEMSISTTPADADIQAERFYGFSLTERGPMDGYEVR